VKVLWVSCDPELGTGYANQTNIWTRYLRDQGYDVAISSYYRGRDWEGKQDTPRDWHGITIYPPPDEGNCHALHPQWAREHQADVIVVLADIWVMDFQWLTEWPVFAWVPVDCSPLSIGDTYALKTYPVHPVAMSEHGLRELTAAGLPAGYVPHAIDTMAWQPEQHRDQLRAAFGIPPGMFAVGMNYNNIDPIRKATPECFRAFAEFHAKVPNSVLYAHTIAAMDRSLDQRVLARTLGITEHVRFADQDRVHTGRFTEADMIRWTCAMDVLVNATYGEGFGLPALEAQAVGTPVILADNTTGPQLRGPGWLVPTEPFWNITHGAWWGRPSIHGIKKALHAAHQDKSPFKRQACRVFAQKYDIREVGPMWTGILDRAGSGLVEIGA
jgi:glycosyltransferase involved in cell wall biosynthesis